MSSPAPSMLDNLTLNVTQEIHVRASLDATFAALLEQLGPYNEVGEGKPMPMVIEAWPGGRWFRDLGEGNGHYWGTVQAIKKPTLLEICGPLFMSHPVANNLQYRLSEVPGGTLIKFHHSAFGLLVEGDRNVKDGWKYIHERVVRRAESARAH
jgi:hypothetical protein